MKQILWDRENDLPATNWDGSVPVVVDGTVFISDLGCNCDPTTGSMCGGCIETFTEFLVDKNERYFHKTPNQSFHIDRESDGGFG